MKLFLDFHSRIPIYEQIKEQIVGLVGQGTLKADDQLPSLRQLSSELAVNINTIKRAFSELESKGIIYSVAGKGSFVSGNSQKNAIIDSALEDAGLAISKAKSMGVKKDAIMTLINNIYEGDEAL